MVIVHEEKKEAAKSAGREIPIQEQMEREDIWNEERRANEEANRASRERISKARKEAAKKGEEKAK